MRTKLYGLKWKNAGKLTIGGGPGVLSNPDVGKNNIAMTITFSIGA